MKIRRIYLFALAGLMFVIAIKVDSDHIAWVGFWDGFVSELDAAEKTLATYFAWFCIAMGVWLLGLGFLLFRVNVKRQLLCACIVFLFVTAVIAVIDLHFRTYMMDSAGG
jgi:hypothetical protein